MGFENRNVLTGIDQIILRGKAPWTLSRITAGHEAAIKKELLKKSNTKS